MPPCLDFRPRLAQHRPGCDVGATSVVIASAVWAPAHRALRTNTILHVASLPFGSIIDCSRLCLLPDPPVYCCLPGSSILLFLLRAATVLQIACMRCKGAQRNVAVVRCLFAYVSYTEQHMPPSCSVLCEICTTIRHGATCGWPSSLCSGFGVLAESPRSLERLCGCDSVLFGCCAFPPIPRMPCTPLRVCLHASALQCHFFCGFRPTQCLGCMV